jgi:hypothetical protein
VSRSSTPVADLDGAPVHVGGVKVGAVRDLFADARCERVVGFEVVGRDGRHWFLPWAVSRVATGAVHSPSALMFVAGEQLAFYDRHGVRLPPEERRAVVVNADGRILDSAVASSDGVLATTSAGISER